VSVSSEKGSGGVVAGGSMFREVHVAHNIAYSSFSGREMRMFEREHSLASDPRENRVR
jgi:hypothetical protein